MKVLEIIFATGNMLLYSCQESQLTSGVTYEIKYSSVSTSSESGMKINSKKVGPWIYISGGNKVISESYYFDGKEKVLT